MTLFYSIDWRKVAREQVVPRPPKPKVNRRLAPLQGRLPNPSTKNRNSHFNNPNIIAIRVTGLNDQGDIIRITKIYEDWLCICTDKIEAFVREIQYYFPGITVRYEKLNCDAPPHQKILPYFPERMRCGRFENEKGYFYKVYVNSPIEDVGQFFRRYDVAFFRKSDWIVRLYIDFCTRYKSDAGYYYQWYEYDAHEPMLINSLRMQNNTSTCAQTLPKPRWTMAAFDIETIPSPSAPRDRVPDGMDPGDRIVMISFVIWKEDDSSPPEEKVLYLNPLSTLSKRNTLPKKNSLRLNNPNFLEYDSESKLLNDFHYFVRDCHVLTGYNINNFDIPCIFARLLFLKRLDLLARYSSRTVGDYKIMTFSDKIVIDLYHYFRIFSNYDLSSFKLDQVARTKLSNDCSGGEVDDETRKMAIDSVGIHVWYNRLRYADKSGSPDLDSLVRLCRYGSSEEEEKDEKITRYCYDVLGACERVSDPLKFGTYPKYIKYCLRDSQVVRKLFLKEMVLSFLITRANFAAMDVVQAMHYGNSRFLLELFQTYGTQLGFFINVDHFQNRSDGGKHAAVLLEGGTYQGALNYCFPQTYFENVSVLDFTSMYPISLLSTNLSYETCDILSIEEYEKLDVDTKRLLAVIPYRKHTDLDFVDGDHLETYHHLRQDSCGEEKESDYEFRYPSLDPTRDKFVIVVNQTVQAFLPSVVKHFLDLRKYHQREWKRTRNVIHYNSQLCIKLLINSLYGTMASKDSPLAYIVVAMSIVTLARYQLLGSYHYVSKILGYPVCYADTDSLMVERWPHDHCDVINKFLDTLPYVEIKFEQRMRRLLVLSKKRYVYETTDRQIVSKGFQKKVNSLVQFMSDRFVKGVMGLQGTKGNASDGWILWVETLLQAHYMCRDPKKYAVTRKTRKLSEYISKTCAAVRMLQKYPEKEGDYVDFAFSRADVAQEEAQSWVMSVEDCQYVNFEKLFINQKKIFCTILNIGFWKLKDFAKPCDAVLNALRWKKFVHAELLHYFATGSRLVLLVEKGVKYTFHINNHTFDNKKALKRPAASEMFIGKKVKCR